MDLVFASRKLLQAGLGVQYFLAQQYTALL